MPNVVNYAERWEPELLEIISLTVKAVRAFLYFCYRIGG